LICDTGFGVIDQLKSEFSHRIINCGIMEQGTLGIAAGMSMSGLIPVVYSILNFLVFRSLEQIRNDIVLQNLNVKLIGKGADNYFKFLGHSHCCAKDDIKLMEMIHCKVYDPCADSGSFHDTVDEWIRDEKPGYIRV
jgi:transketolase